MEEKFGGLARLLEGGENFLGFWAEKMCKCLWWWRRSAGHFGVNRALGEEGGCLVNAWEEFGGLGVGVCGCA